MSRQLCLQCVLGSETAETFQKAITDSSQLPLGYDLTPNGFLRFPPRVELISFTPQIVQLLVRDPDRMRELSPDAFELLICDRLDDMGFDLVRGGSHAYHKDGGIDIIAWPRTSVVPFLVAVQVKHTSSTSRKIGPDPVRALLGTLGRHRLNAGLLVTNTTFTPSAKWEAEQHAFLMKLRDFNDLRRWLKSEYLPEHEWREIPRELEICPGIIVKLPR